MLFIHKATCYKLDYHRGGHLLVSSGDPLVDCWIPLQHGQHKQTHLDVTDLVSTTKRHLWSLWNRYPASRYFLWPWLWH